MRFRLFSLISLVFMLCPLCSNRALADSIQGNGCSVNSSLCDKTATATGYLQLSAANSYSTLDAQPGGASSDSHSVSGTYNGLPAAASGSFSVGFDGFHTVLSASGSASCIVRDCTTAGAEAFSAAYITDYFGVGSVPQGTSLLFQYSLDATGNSFITTPDQYGNTKYTSAEIAANFVVNGSRNTGQCTNNNVTDGFNVVSGSFSTVCTVLVPLDSNQVVKIQLIPSAVASGDYSTALLDASNTVKLNSATLVDASGNPISGADLYDASGYDYNAKDLSVAETPEPSSLLLLGTGLFGLVPLSRKFGKRQPS